MFKLEIKSIPRVLWGINRTPRPPRANFSGPRVLISFLHISINKSKGAFGALGAFVPDRSGLRLLRSHSAFEKPRIEATLLLKELRTFENHQVELLRRHPAFENRLLRSHPAVGNPARRQSGLRSTAAKQQGSRAAKQ